LTHSLDLRTGGVAKAVCDLSDAFKTKNVENFVFDNPSSKQLNPLLEANLVIAHGLWQWPGRSAVKLKKKYDVPYIVFPHGMLDPWFKENYPLKHLKKTIILVLEAIQNHERCLCGLFYYGRGEKTFQQNILAI
jgi:glycosyltransferase involved in cell wall biosynthesis